MSYGETNAQYLNSGNYGADLAKTIVVYCKSDFQDEKCFKDKDNASGFWKTMRNLFLLIIPAFFLSMAIGGEIAASSNSLDFLGPGMIAFFVMIFFITLCSQSYYEYEHNRRNFGECVRALYHHCMDTFTTKEDYEYLAEQNIYFKELCIRAGILEEKKELY